MVMIPVYDDQLHILRTVEFTDNLTLSHVPDYVNQNGLMGLKRLKRGRWEGCLVIMYYDKRYPSHSYAEFISEEEAYHVCLNRGKLELATQLGINYPEQGRSVW